MHKNHYFLTAVIVSILLAACSAPSGSGGGDEAAAVPAAESVVASLAAGDVAAVTARFDATMQTAMPAEQLKAVWDGLLADAGPFREQVKSRYERAQGHDIVFVTCAFERKSFDIQVTLNDQQQVAGLFIRPGSA